MHALLSLTDADGTCEVFVMKKAEDDVGGGETTWKEGGFVNAVIDCNLVHS